MHEIKVSYNAPKVYAWDWDYPIEKNTKVTLICGSAPKRITEIIDSYFDINYQGFAKNTAGRMIPISKNGATYYVVVILYDWSNTNHQISVLSHETNHLVFTHFKERGHHIPSDPNANDEENFCSHHEMWMQYFLDALNSKDKKEALFTFNNETTINTSGTSGKKTSRKPSKTKRSKPNS